MTVLLILFTFWCLIVGVVTLAAVVIVGVYWAGQAVRDVRHDRWQDRQMRRQLQSGQDLWSAPTSRDEQRRARP